MEPLSLPSLVIAMRQAALEGGDGGADTGGAAAEQAEPVVVAPADSEFVSTVDYSLLDTEFVLPARKKQKLAKVAEEFSIDKEEEESAASTSTIEDNFAWSGSDRDYQYAELLERVFDTMRAKNPGTFVRAAQRPVAILARGRLKRGSRQAAATHVDYVDACPNADDVRGLNRHGARRTSSVCHETAASNSTRV